MNKLTGRETPSRSVRIAVGVVIVIAGAVIASALLKSARRAETVTLATASQPIGAVVCVAAKMGYFEAEGLRIVNQPYRTGKDALQAVIEGKAEVCEVAETPVVFAVLKGTPVRIFASVAWSQRNMALIGRRDLGIRKEEDLQGKKVGVTMRTNGEFFLHQFLASHQISMDGVALENLPPDAMLGALTQGAVDAVVTWNPYVAHLRKTQGTNAVAFYDNTYVWTWNLATLPAYLDVHPGRTRKILRAMLRASDFIRSKPAEARAVVAASLGMDPALLAEIWQDFSFGVALENMLLLSLNSQAKWVIENKLSDARALPDFRPAIHTGALKALMPEAVTLSDPGQ